MNSSDSANASRVIVIVQMHNKVIQVLVIVIIVKLAKQKDITKDTGAEWRGRIPGSGEKDGDGDR